jgi:putative oxidoreductase
MIIVISLNNKLNIQKLILYGPLPIRLLAGLAFIAHGIPKLSDPAMTQGFFGNIGLSPELAIPIGLLEVIGGIALLVGVVTRIASSLFIIEMIGVTIIVKLSEGFVGGFELELLLMSVAISLLLTGPGKISIEYDILKREIFPKGKMIVNEIRQREPR